MPIYRCVWPFVLLLSLAACSDGPAGGSPGDGNEPPASGGSHMGGSGAGGEPPEATGGDSSSAAGTGSGAQAAGGSAGDAFGGSASGGSSSGGQGSGGEGAGGSSTGGSDSGGTGGSGTGGSGTGGSGASGGSPLAVRFDYFHDEAHISYRSEAGGAGQLVELAGVLPVRFSFPEADVDETGLFSRRRHTVVYLFGGSFYRLEGSADSFEPPPPVRVTHLQGVTNVCTGIPVTHPTDRSANYLRLTYGTTGSCASNTQSALLPLSAGPADAPLALDPKTAELRDPLGNTDAFLRLDGGALTAVSGLDATEPIAHLMPLVFVQSYYAQPLGDGRYVLVVTKGSALQDIYYYDTSDHSVAGPLGSNFSWIDGPGGHRNGDATALFFTATASGVTRLYRLRKDGSHNVEQLSGVTGTLSILGVVDGKVFYSTGGATANVYSVPTQANFSTVTPTLVLGGGNVAPNFLSEDRLFYTRHLNAIERRLGVVHLDGTGQEELPNESFQWVGCAYDPSADRPLAVDIGLCRHAFAWSYFFSNEVRTYDLAPGGAGFFTDVTRGPILHGAIGSPPSFVQSLVMNRTGTGALGAGFLGFEAVGTFYGKDASDPQFRHGIVALPAPGSGQSPLTQVYGNGRSTWWLN